MEVVFFVFVATNPPDWKSFKFLKKNSKFEVVTCFLVVLIESFHYNLIHMIRIRLFLLPELERNIIDGSKIGWRAYTKMNVVSFTKTQRYIESHWYWELDKQKTRERTNNNEVGDCIVVVVAPVYGSWMTDENQRQVRENETTNGWHKKTITAHNIEPIHFQLNLARVGTHTLQSKRDRAAPFSRSTSTDFFCNEQLFFCVLFSA